MKSKQPKIIDSNKALLKIIKEMKSDRHLFQKRVNEFNSRLAKDLELYNVVVSQLNTLSGKIQDNQHLIEMYAVMDDNTIMDIWKLEKAVGLTTKKYPDWKIDFEKTKDGFKFKKNNA